MIIKKKKPQNQKTNPENKTHSFLSIYSPSPQHLVHGLHTEPDTIGVDNL